MLVLLMFIRCKCLDLQSRHWQSMFCPPLERAFPVPCMYPDASWLQCPIDCCISLKTDYLSKIRNSHTRWELDAPFGLYWLDAGRTQWCQEFGSTCICSEYFRITSESFHMIAGTLPCYNSLAVQSMFPSSSNLLYRGFHGDYLCYVSSAWSSFLWRSRSAFLRISLRALGVDVLSLCSLCNSCQMNGCVRLHTISYCLSECVLQLYTKCELLVETCWSKVFARPSQSTWLQASRLTSTSLMFPITGRGSINR